MPQGKHFTARLRATPENLRSVRCLAEAYLGAEHEKTSDVQLLLTEAVANTIQHGYNGSGPGYVTVELRREGDRLCVSVRDEGRGFAAAPAKPGAGLGLALIKAVSDEIEITETEGGGTLLRARIQLAPVV
jgi:anti-sigma regulatory factor (Ser/Thr protein kinase)